MNDDATLQNQDISKIISALTESPALLAEIKGLVEKNTASESATTDAPVPESTPVSAIPTHQSFGGSRRRGELLSALKPYVSEGRARAIDTMMTFSQILDMMKER